MSGPRLFRLDRNTCLTFRGKKRHIFGVDRNLCLTSRVKNDAFLEWTETFFPRQKRRFLEWTETSASHLEWTETSASLSEAKRRFLEWTETSASLSEAKTTHFWSGPKPLPHFSEAKTTHFWSGPKPLPHFPRQKRRFLEWTETSASHLESKMTHFWSGPKPLPHFPRQKRRIFGVDRNLCLTFRGKNDAFLEWTETSASLSEAKTTHFWSGPKPLPHFPRQKRRIFGVDRNLCLTFRGKNDPFLEWTETSASLSEAKTTHFWSGPKPLPHFPRQKRRIFAVDRNLCLTFRGKNDAFLEWTETSASLSEAKTTHFWSGPKPLPHFLRQKRPIFGVDRNLCLTFRGKNDAFLEWTETSASLSEAKTTHFWSGPKPLPQKKILSRPPSFAYLPPFSRA